MTGGGRTELSRRSSRKRGFLDSFAYDYGGSRTIGVVLHR
jgi:hypothetical protein